jgi:hypothetical protein
MKEKYKKVLDWFRFILKNEIGGAVRFLDYDIEDMKDEKQKKYFKDRYSPEICSATTWMSELAENEQLYMKRLLQLYTSDAFHFFFKRLEEGENSGDIGRINFELKAINDVTNEEVILISSDENDKIYNDFQGWILDNCSDFKNKDN